MRSSVPSAEVPASALIDRQRLTDAGGRVLRALHDAAIDPGELPWGEVRQSAALSPQNLAMTLYQLRNDGLVVLGDWNGYAYRTVNLKDEAVVHDRLSAPQLRGEWFTRTLTIDAWVATLVGAGA